MWPTYGMTRRTESASDIERWLREQSARLWPAALGSLSLRRSPCVRENCPACARGEQHPSHVLYCRVKGKRVGIYIPEELVEQVSRCLDNGRALQELLHEAAQRYALALKQQRVQKAKR